MAQFDIIQFLKFVARSEGMRKSNIITGRWGMYAYPAWTGPGGQMGFKGYAYRGVAGSKERVAKAICSHALTCLVAGVGAGASGLGELGSSLEGVGKFGALKDAFGVDIGAIQLSEVLKNPKRATDIANAIISSGRLAARFIVRVDKTAYGFKIYLRKLGTSSQDASLMDLYIQPGGRGGIISQMHTGDVSVNRHYKVFANGSALSADGVGQSYSPWANLSNGHLY